MFEDLFITFEKPGWLILTVLVIPAYLIARRSIGGLSPLKTHATFAIRSVVILLLAMALAHPTWLKKGEGLSVIVIMDRSRSIPLPLQQETMQYLTAAVDLGGRQPEDRLGIITVGDGAAISALPNRYSSFDNFIDNLPSHDATNLADGLALALATAPKDTAIRFVLTSDGNETEGHVLEAAKLARSNGIPVDVLPLRYSLDQEVIFDRVVAPARAREGQVTSLRLILRAQAETSGTLTLTQNDVPVDLDPDSEGTGIHLTLQPGVNTRMVPILFDEAGPQQFEARFEADDAKSDLIAENNAAVAVTFVGGEGRVLIIDDSVSESAALVDALRASDLSVRVEPAAHLDSLVTIGGYDAIIMVNQHRRDYPSEVDQWLHDYVHDLGGGLIVIGGDRALGAGGWIDSNVEKALPVKLDPPQTMQRQQGALALIMHSCEMPQGNFWAETIAISAIEALSSLDYVGIVDYNWQQGGPVWEWGPALAGDKSGPIAAAKTMPVGDMPDFGSAMLLTYNGLKDLSANKHAIIISDGDPSKPTQQLLDNYAAASITVTTVLVAGHGSPQDLAWMQKIANDTGGRFYNVTNPRKLPGIFIEEARIVARSLIVEDEFVPILQNALAEPIRGFSQVPSIDGYVLTAPKEGLAEIPFVSDQHGDPIYANWNYGIGKAIVYTSDLSGRWGSEWVAWNNFKGFWDQSVRWAMRPVSPANMTVNTHLEGEKAIVEVEAFDVDAQFLNFLSSSAAVLGPEGTKPLSLSQVGPGRYRGEFDVDKAGPYLINMNFRKDGEPVGNLQAAVNVPYAREFRDIRDNAPLLYAIAENTDGRVLPDAPQLAELWDREGLPVRKSHKPIWDLLAIIAATIFLLDVAGRRLSIGAAEVRKSVQRMFGRRGEATEDSVAAWKKARAQVAHRRTAPADADAARDTSDIKFEASEEDQAKAIDVGAATASAPKDQVRAPKRREAPKPAEEEGDFTSRLLAAKRRAREQQQKPDDDGSASS